MDRPIVLIPARSGSTRMPNKNLQKLHQLTLLESSINAALNADVGRVIVSTNDNTIKEVALSAGAEVPFMRPASISTPEAASISVILHALFALQAQDGYIPSCVAFKPPTNPYLKSISITEMINLKLANLSIDSVLSIFEPRHSALSFVGFDPSTLTVNPELYDINGFKLYDAERSQDRPKSYAGSPACKVTNSSFFLEKYKNFQHSLPKATGPTYNCNSTIGYVISAAEAFDIDTVDDLEIARSLYKIYSAE